MRREQWHTQNVKRFTEIAKQPKSKRRGPFAQERRLDMERTIKISAVAFLRWGRSTGAASAQLADLLRMTPSTLSAWRRQWIADRLKLHPRGPRVDQTDPHLREVLMTVFYLVGPGIGIPTLRDLFPELKRAELEDLLQRYRRLYTRKNRVCLHLLRWHKVGSVWAMDFCQPPHPVDGKYPYVFLVRDLASGNQLLSLPVPSRELRHVVDALRVLFIQMSAPLVLKSDNEFDAGFVSRFGDDPQRIARSQLAALLNDFAVTPLLSPPYFPRYNGAIEAGIGAFKTRAHLEAARHGHPLEWNCNDVESARLQANEESRPWGFDQATPDIAWLERTPLSPLDRTALRQSIELYMQEVCQEKQQQLLEAIPLGPRDMASARRVAICRALVKHGLLSIRRKRFTLPFKYKLA
jgi:hypothetical protein